ncbi:hypothetical protein [Candidatus Palauibacter sp.]|uniref:hypothetical protein n=1 Tax=Candidatus Palauibacter sp. TaxID=3101350 RepID=UPI003B52CEE4
MSRLVPPLLFVLLVGFLTPAPVWAQNGARCTTPESQEAIKGFRELLASVEKEVVLSVRVDYEGVYFDPVIWTMMDLDQKKTLIRIADIYHDCVVVTETLGIDPTQRTWSCGVKVFRSDSGREIAAIKGGWLRACEFEFYWP